MMRPEDKSFWSGAVHGIWDGALKGFVVGGIIGVCVLFAAGIFGSLITMGTLGGLAIGIGACITAFISGGIIGAVVGSPVGAIYEGVNEYIEEKEVQRDIERARKLGYIENYTLRSPEKATPPPTPLQTAQANKPVDAPQTKRTVEDTHQESIEAINKIKREESSRTAPPTEQATTTTIAPITTQEKVIETTSTSTITAPQEQKISAVERLNAERMAAVAAAQNSTQSCAI